MKSIKKIFNNIVSKLIVVNVSYGILDILLSSFLVSYIMRSFSNQIVGVAVFYICWAITVGLGFILAADKTKRGNKMAVFRFSIILRIIACVILGTTGLNMPIAVLVGCLLGFSDGYMYMPWHNILSDKLSKRQLIQYTGYKVSVSHTMKIFLPIIIGTFVSLSSYSMMVWLVVPFSMLSYLVSFTISDAPTSRNGVQMVQYFRKCVRDKFTRRLLGAEFIRGMTTDRLQHLMTMLIVYVMYSDIALGAVKSATSVILIIAGVILGRFLTVGAFPKLFTICYVFLIGGTLLFLGAPTATTLVICTLVGSVAENVLFRLLEMNVTNGSNYNKLNRTNKIEYFLVREIVLNLGRVTNLVILLILGLCGAGVLGLTVFALCMILAAIPMAYLSIQVSRDIAHQ